MTVKNIEKILLQDKSFNKYYLKHELEHNIAVMTKCERVKKGWTQEMLAKKAKIKQASLGRLESGNHLPNLKTIRKIAKALDKKLIIKLCG